MSSDENIYQAILYIKTSIRWIMRGFSGHFPPFQLLFLWDLVLAYDSMEVFIPDDLEVPWPPYEDKHFGG